MPSTHVRTARGVIHSLTVGREYTDQGRRLSNIAGYSIGKADCGAITSGAGIVTDEPVNCPRCLPRPPADVLDRAPTVADVRAWPHYFINGPGRAVAEVTKCPHQYLLTSSCPGCDYDEDRARESAPGGRMAP